MNPGEKSKRQEPSYLKSESESEGEATTRTGAPNTSRVRWSGRPLSRSSPIDGSLEAMLRRKEDDRLPLVGNAGNGLPRRSLPSRGYERWRVSNEESARAQLMAVQSFLPSPDGPASALTRDQRKQTTDGSPVSASRSSGQVLFVLELSSTISEDFTCRLSSEAYKGKNSTKRIISHCAAGLACWFIIWFSRPRLIRT